MMREQHEVLLARAVKRWAAHNGLQQGFGLRRPLAERNKQGDRPCSRHDGVRDLNECCRLSGSRRRNNGNFIESLQRRG